MDKPKLVVNNQDKGEETTREAENWLAKEPKGAVFLYRPYGSKRVNLSIRQVLYHWGDVALLGVNLNGEDKPPETEYVDTRLFSNINEKVKTIFVMPTEEEQELQKEQDNDGTQVHPKAVE